MCVVICWKELLYNGVLESLGTQILLAYYVVELCKHSERFDVASCTCVFVCEQQRGRRVGFTVDAKTI